jgi:hypothetical protein
MRRPGTRLLALLAMAATAVIALAGPAGALPCPTPCVEVTNDYPYAYAKLCPPL